jgi:hypothetical protein
VIGSPAGAASAFLQNAEAVWILGKQPMTAVLLPMHGEVWLLFLHFIQIRLQKEGNTKERVEIIDIAVRLTVWQQTGQAGRYI